VAADALDALGFSQAEAATTCRHVISVLQQWLQVLSGIYSSDSLY